jgi:hypothetical protein
VCWFIELTIIPQKKGNKVDIQLPFWRGSFPQYLYSRKTMCSCGDVLDKGTRTAEGLSEDLARVLALDMVKRVELMYYWSTRPAKRDEEKLPLDEFCRMNREGLLRADIVYRISIPRQWK